MLESGKDYTFYHPFSTADQFTMRKNAYASFMPLLTKKMENGRRISPERSLKEIQETSAALLGAFDKSYKRLINPHIYKVSLSEKLRSLKTDLLVEARQKESTVRNGQDV